MTIMPGHEVEIIDLTQIVGEFSLPCDYDRIFRCGPRAAEWVMMMRCPCGTRGERLVCSGCKDATMHREDGLLCPNLCGVVIVPARKAIAYIEPLDRA